MLVTQETDYVARTVLYFAKKHDWIASVNEVAQAMHNSKSILAKNPATLIKAISCHQRGVIGEILTIQ
jgi:DNA-binding IscR family transcriptional regulator